MKSLRQPISRHCVAVSAFAALIAAMTFSGDASAADPKTLGVFGDWTAYALKEKAGPVCYIASQPKKAEGKIPGRGDIFALITHRPAEKSLNVLSIVAGYPLKEGGDVVEITIGRKSWKLFTKGDRAWAPDAETDAAIAVALTKAAGTFSVKGTSAKGAQSLDTYSAIGFTAAYEAIGKECGVKAK